MARKKRRKQKKPPEVDSSAGEPGPSFKVGPGGVEIPPEYIPKVVGQVVATVLLLCFVLIFVGIVLAVFGVPLSAQFITEHLETNLLPPQSGG